MVKIDSLKHCESFRMIGSWHIIIESEKWLIKLVSVVHRLLHDFLLLTFSYFDGSSLSRLMADLCSNIQCITSCSGKIRFSNGRNDQDVVERKRRVSEFVFKCSAIEQLSTLFMSNKVYENERKCLIFQHCERSELRLQINEKCQN